MFISNFYDTSTSINFKCRTEPHNMCGYIMSNIMFLKQIR